MDATNFLTASPASAEALKTASLLKTLSVNAVIAGETGTGKKTLAQYILPGAVVKSASDSDVLNTLESNSDVILTHIEHSPNLSTLLGAIREHGTRVVATASAGTSLESLESVFSVSIVLPPLSERPEDVDLLIGHFCDEADRMFGELGTMTTIVPDLSKNAHSLRRQVYFNRLLGNVTEMDVMQVVEHFLEPRLGSHNDYRQFLHLYEVPLIRCGLRRFGSQLQLSQQLGLNRNTLRKKIAEHEAFGLEESAKPVKE